MRHAAANIRIRLSLRYLQGKQWTSRRTPGEKLEEFHRFM